MVCHIILRLEVGGLENGLVNLINHLPQDEFKHTIVCLQHAGDFRCRITRPDVSIHELHKPDGKALHLYGQVRQLLRELRPDIVHTRNIPTLDMLLPARLAGIKRLVHSEHGLDQFELTGNNRKYNLLRRASRLLARHYITVSTDLADWLQTRIGIAAKDVTAIHNGVDTEKFQPRPCDETSLPSGFLPASPFVIGTLGRFESVKDQSNLARAFVAMIQQRPALREQARLMLVGDGSQRAAIEAILTEGGVRELCWLPGFRDDAPALYRCLDLFVLPSQREGISNTALEAMASGLPVLATRVGGNPEIIIDGVTGQLVPAQDPLALTAALLGYIDAPARLAEQSAAARAHILKSFSLSAMVARYRQVYLNL